MKRIYLFIMCLISYGAYSQVNVQDTLQHYAGLYSAGSINLQEFDTLLTNFFSDLPSEQQFNRYHKEFLRGRAFWKDRVTLDSAGNELKGYYTRQLMDYLDSPTCANGDDAYWKYAFDPTPIITFGDPEDSLVLGSCGAYGKHAAGIIRSIYMNPADNNIILAGSGASGIWRSDNGGATWSNRTDDLRIPALAIRDIIDISKPSQSIGQVLLAVTGRDRFNDSYGVGVLKSTDFGQTWTQHDLPIISGGGMPVLRGATKPYSETDTVFVFSKTAVYYSDDFAETWSELGTVPSVSGEYFAMSSSSGTANYVYLGSKGENAQLFRSKVGTIVWEDLTLETTMSIESCGIVEYNETFDFESGFEVLDTNTYYDPDEDILYEITFEDIDSDIHASIPSLTVPGWAVPTYGVGGLFMVYALDDTLNIDSIQITCNAGIPEGATIEFYTANSYDNDIEEDGDFIGQFEYGFTDEVIAYSNTFSVEDDFAYLIVRFDFNDPYLYADTTPVLFDDFHFEIVKEPTYEPSGFALSKSNGDEIHTAVQAFDTLTDKYRLFLLNSVNSGVSWSCVGVGSGTNTHDTGDILAFNNNLEVGYGDMEGGYYYGGVKFIRYDTDLNDYYEVCTQHDDTRDIQVVKNEGGHNHIIVGDDGGVSYSPDGGITWNSLNGTGLPVTQFYNIAISPHDQKTILGGTQDNGTFMGNQPNWKTVGDGDGGDVGFSPLSSKPDLFYFNVNGRTVVRDYYEMADDVIAIYNFHPGGLFNGYLGRPAVIDPLNGGYIFEGYQGASNKTYKNAVLVKHDFQEDFIDVYDFPAPSREIGEIEVALANPDFIYAADGVNRTTYEKAKFFVSIDYAENFTDITDTINAVLDEDGNPTSKTFQEVLGWKHVNAIETNPEDATEVWVGISGINKHGDDAVGGEFRVLHSTDTGRTWQDYSIGLPPFPINDLIYQKGTNDRLFAATDVGIFYRDASMDSWQCFQEGMPASFALDLEINDCQQALYAGTFGRGIWRSFIDFPDTEPIVVDTDLSWGGTQQFENDILIESGNTLTLTGTLQMAGNKKIIVEPGAELIVDGGVLTNLCDVFWGGIEVQGNHDQTQTSTNQGKVVLRNGALVEQARVGVALWETGNWTSTGGIIIASNSTFKNNKKDVEFLNYQNTDGSGGHLPNKSYFTNVTFTWDNDFLADYPLGHVTLYKVDGIKFRGCTFNDLRSEPDSRYFVDYAKTNSGIYSIDAQYFVIPQCTDYISGCSGSLEDDPDWNPTTFENLDFGVYASNISSEQNLTVDRSIFENNLYGLQTVNVNDPIITRNEFEVNGDTTNNFTGYTQRGIHLVRSKGLTVQENHFANTSGTGAVQGIVCSDLGESDEDIYRNVFDDLKYGVIAQGKNRGISDEGDLLGLEFLCDTNSGNFKDHLVLGSLWETETSGEFGVKVFNGAIDEPSGTVFSLDDPLPTGIHYTNESENELRYYFDDGEINQEPTDVVGDVFAWSTDFDNTCASKLSDDSFQGHSSGFLSTMLTNFNTYSADLDTVLTAYQGLVNGGDTDSLLNVIAGLTRDNRDTLHTLLMSYSPYLTAEVVKATLDHPIIKYPHAWGYELVESNIEVAYTPGFFTFLENKLNPFTPTMIADVQALVDSNAYTDMLTKQLEIAQLQSQKANAANVLLQSVKNDTNSVDVDSVRYWIAQKGDVLAKTREIDAYLQAGDITAAESALTLLNTDLQNYPTHLQDELTDYISFKEKLIDLHQAENSLDSLSETDHNFMIDLAENGVGLARYQAQELLCFFYGECAEYPVNPDGQQNMAPISTDTDPSETDESERGFKIYPNPANTWIAIELPKVDQPLNITVIDLTGRLVYQKQLGGINNTDRLSAVEIWDTQLIGDGVYLITITNQNNTESFGTQRVVIQH